MEKIIDLNIYNYSIDEMEKLCQLKKNYTLIMKQLLRKKYSYF